MAKELTVKISDLPLIDEINDGAIMPIVVSGITKKTTAIDLKNYVTNGTEIGLQGHQGFAGSNGAQGSQGNQGTGGSTGAQGAQGGLTGSVTFTQGTDIASATSVDDYALGAGTFFSITGTTASNITGFSGGSVGRFLIVLNNTNKNQTFQQEDTNSLASNRFVLGNANKTVGVNSTATFIYAGGLTIGASNNQSRWVLVATS